MEDLTRVHVAVQRRGNATSCSAWSRQCAERDAVPVDVLADAVEAGVLVGRLGLTDAKGGPLCASVRPPLIQWSAAAG